MVPEKQLAAEVPHLTHLDVRMLDTPAISVMQSQKQILFMADTCEIMLQKLAVVLDFDKPDEELEKSIFHGEQILDTVQKEIMVFLSELISGQVPHDVTEKVRGQMRMADEYESISDYAASLLKGLRKLRADHLQLSPEGQNEFKKMNSLLLDYLRKTGIAVRAEDPQAAVRLLPVNSEINHFIKDCRQAHLIRVTEGKVPPLNSLIYTDLLNYYRRINDHTLNIAEVAAGEK
jgi:phosphate:Na+ symporter